MDKVTKINKMKKSILLSLLIMFSFFSQNLFSQDRKKMNDGRRERMEIVKKRMDNKDVKKNPIEILQLNENQKNEFQKIQTKYRESFSNSKNFLKKKRLELELEKMNENFNQSKIDNLFDEISIIVADIKKMTFKKDNDIKSILSKDQIVMFERLTKRREMIGKRN
jgi:Spy/CpxP family protein refolding chaperone